MAKYIDIHPNLELIEGSEYDKSLDAAYEAGRFMRENGIKRGSSVKIFYSGEFHVHQISRSVSLVAHQFLEGYNGKGAVA